MPREIAKSRAGYLATRQRIRELHEKGLSRSTICERLGLTKGQVDGILYKEQLRALVPPGSDTSYVAPRQGPRNRPSEPTVLDEILPVEVDFEPPAGKFNIYNVSMFQCRWIEEDGYFCGEATRPLRSYCDNHHDLCWVKTKRQIQNAT